MSFPTSRDIDGFGHWLLARGVADAVSRLRPDIAERVAFLEEPPGPAVKVTLPGGGNVIFARARRGSLTTWVIATPVGEPSPVTDAAGGAAEVASRIIVAYDRLTCPL